MTNIKAGGDGEGIVVASSGPTNWPLDGDREDIGYVAVDTEVSVRY